MMRRWSDGAGALVVPAAGAPATGASLSRRGRHTVKVLPLPCPALSQVTLP